LNPKKEKRRKQTPACRKGKGGRGFACVNRERKKREARTITRSGERGGEKGVQAPCFSCEKEEGKKKKKKKSVGLIFVEGGRGKERTL